MKAHQELPSGSGNEWAIIRQCVGEMRSEYPWSFWGAMALAVIGVASNIAIFMTAPAEYIYGDVIGQHYPAAAFFQKLGGNIMDALSFAAPFQVPLAWLIAGAIGAFLYALVTWLPEYVKGGGPLLKRERTATIVLTMMGPFSIIVVLLTIVSVQYVRKIDGP